MVNNLDYEGIKFLIFKKILARLKSKIIFALVCFVMQNNLVYLVYVSNEKFENCIDLLLIANENKSHYVYIKDFDTFMCNITKIRIKNTFSSIVYNLLVMKKFW